MIKIEHAQLSQGLFLGNTNLTEKLDSKQRPALSMQLDDQTWMLHVCLKTPSGEHRSIVKDWMCVNLPTDNVVPIESAHPVIQNKIDAQVSTPQSHVFAGEGKGDTGQGKKVK